VGESGAKDSRPELNNLMADARKRKFDIMIVSAVAQLERDLIRERVSAGIRHARACGKQLGRRPAGGRGAGRFKIVFPQDPVTAEP
jgi:DNA invertase Pin-like site-specific DNA recombinase